MSMRDYLRGLQRQQQEEDEAAAARRAAERVSADYQKHRQEDAMARIRRGLHTLLDQLHQQGIPCEGWAKNKVYRSGDYRRNDVTVAYRRDHPRFTRGKDPVWYLGEFVSGYTPMGADTPVTYTLHHFISESGLVIGGEFAPQIQSFDSWTGDVRKTAADIIWSAVHYCLDWPVTGPDLQDLV